MRILGEKKLSEDAYSYSYRTDRALSIILVLSLAIGYYSVQWSETGSIVSALVANLIVTIGLPGALFAFTREFFITTTVKVNSNSITSYDFLHRELCSVDLTKDVYYDYHRFEEYIEIKVSNQNFYGDKVKPRHFSLNYIRSNSEVYLPLIGEAATTFPKKDWIYVPEGAVIVRHRDIKTKPMLYYVLFMMVISMIILAWVGAVYFFPLPYSKSTSGYDLEGISSTVLCNKTTSEAQFDTIYFDQEEDYVVAWSREFIIPKEHATRVDVRAFFESKYPGITELDYVSTRVFEDADNYYYVINIFYLNNSVAGTKVSNTQFVYLPYYEGDTFLEDASNELKSYGSHYMTGKDLKKYHLHSPTEEEIFEKTINP